MQVTCLSLTTVCVDPWPMLLLRCWLDICSACIRYSAVFFFTASRLVGLGSPGIRVQYIFYTKQYVCSASLCSSKFNHVVIVTTWVNQGLFLARCSSGLRSATDSKCSVGHCLAHGSLETKYGFEVDTYGHSNSWPHWPCTPCRSRSTPLR